MGSLMRLLWMSHTTGITFTEIREPSKVKVNIDIDPRMPEYVERAGAAEDTIFIPVDEHEPSRVLKIGSHLQSRRSGIA